MCVFGRVDTIDRQEIVKWGWRMRQVEGEVESDGWMSGKLKVMWRDRERERTR